MQFPNFPTDREIVDSKGGLLQPWWLFLALVAKDIREGCGLFTFGTHLQRTTATTRGYIGPGTIPTGGLFLETDRGFVIYQSRLIASSPTWVYLAGETSGTVISVDQRPIDMGVNDAGFTFYGTDTFTYYTWSGTAWAMLRELGSIRSNTHAVRLATPAANQALNTIFFENDRNALYLSQGGAWKHIRPVIFECLQADLPADLTAADEGFLAWVTNYSHMLEWDGAAWKWGPGESGSGFIQSFIVAPNADGWHICDGSSVPYLKPDGTLGSSALPDLASVPAYLKMGGGYSGFVSAVAPLTSPPLAASAGAAAGGLAVASAGHTHIMDLSSGDPIDHLGVMAYFRQ